MVIDRFNSILKKAFIATCLLVACLSTALADSDIKSSAQDLKPVDGKRAPQINLPFLGKNAGHDADKIKETRLVHFWASWCVPCREEFPALQRLHDDYKEKGLSILTIAADNEQAVMQYVLQQKIDLPVMIDQYGKALFDYKVKALPSSYLVDRDGKIRYMANGHVMWDSHEIRQKLQHLIDEQ